MSEFLNKLFLSDFMPHGYCYLWNPGILWLHAVSDGIIALSYYFIPVTLIYFVRRRRDLPFHWMFFMFGAFIFGCGTTHLMEVWTLWHGTYRLAGVIKALTATASLATAVLLALLVPQALALPSPAQLRAANLNLETEIAERLRIAEALETAHNKLELRVRERTTELAQANMQLRNEIAEHRHTEQTLQETRAQLAHTSRLMTVGALTTSIAHEMNQPLAAVVLNGQACLRLLDRATPDLDEAREGVKCIIRDGYRAGEIIRRVRTLVKKNHPEKERIDLNTLIGETVALLHGEIERNRIVLEMDLASDLPVTLGDRVQLQQAILNLMMNGVEAMQSVEDRQRVLMVKSRFFEEESNILVGVEDSGIGLGSDSVDHLFELFFTTKPGGMGMGLSICRSIITAHNGRLWAEPNGNYGVTFLFTLPAHEQEVSQPKLIRTLD